MTSEASSAPTWERQSVQAGEWRITALSDGFFRLDGSLINWITINERVIIEGDAINYDPETQAAVIAGIPVRSKGTGPWDLDGQ